ncbi:MAG: hypothetical protein NVS3B7_04100 [Candidatus Elarobacter sp.]
MPLANPNASFDVAARHLFRHLDEPGRLRRNPLVRRFFEDSGGRMTRARAKAALALIVRIIEQGAEHVRALDAAAGEDERAYRQHTILRRTYIERAPILTIASDLGLSIRQYYRERSAICARIARYVESFDARVATATPYARLDPLRFQMEQAAQRVELGDVEAAARAYELVLHAGESVATKIEVLCRLVDIAAEGGDDVQASARLNEARELLVSDAYEMASLARAAQHVHVALVQSRAAWHAGRAQHAAGALAEAAQIAETLLPEGGKRIRELVAEVLVERAQRRADLGYFTQALGDLARANQVHDALPDPSLRQRSDVLRLRAILEMSAPEPFATPPEVFAPLCEALELARACGSAKRTILATASLCEQYGYVGNERAAADAADRSMKMAEHIASPRFRGSVALMAADSLLPTRYWKRALRILDGAEATIAVGSFDWVKLKTLQAEYHRRCGRSLESHVCAAASERYARMFGSRRLQGAAFRTLAMSTHALGRFGEARAYVEEAIDAVDKHGSALSRSMTYRFAAKIAWMQMTLS